MSWLVHLNGWPGTGKRSIGRALAERTGARLLDNHVLLNPAEALFDRRDPLNASLRRAVRDAAFDHAARLPRAVPLILTGALADDAEDAAVFGEARALAARRGVPFLGVVLEIGAEENERRLVAPGRAEALKLTRVPVLRRMRGAYVLLPPGEDGMTFDVSDLPAAAAAAAIAARLDGIALTP